MQQIFNRLVPSKGLCFRDSTSKNPGINCPGLASLFDTGIFDDFKKRHPKVPIQFIWVVEKSTYETFKKQDFYDAQEVVCKKEFPLRNCFKDVQQMVFGVDLGHTYYPHHDQRREKAVDMTRKTAIENLEKGSTKKLLSR